MPSDLDTLDRADLELAIHELEEAREYHREAAEYGRSDLHATEADALTRVITVLCEHLIDRHD